MPRRAANNLSDITIQFPDSEVTRRLVGTTNNCITTPDTGASNEPDPAATRRMRRSLNRTVRVVVSKNRIKVNLRSAVISFARSIPIILHPNCVSLRVLRRALKSMEVSGKLVTTSDGIHPGTPNVGCHRCTPGTSLTVIRKPRRTIIGGVGRLTTRTGTRNRRIKVVTASRAGSECPRNLMIDVKDQGRRRAVTRRLCRILQSFSRDTIESVCSRTFCAPEVKRTVVGHLLGTTKRGVVRIM